MQLSWDLHYKCFDHIYMKVCLLYLKFGVMDTRESGKTENAIHWEQHTFHIFLHSKHVQSPYTANKYWNF